jgi:hypothetical protein
MALRLTPGRMLLGAGLTMVAGTWNLVHGKSAGAQSIVVGAVILAAIFSALRGKQTQATGALAEAHAARHQLLDKILVSFVSAIVIFLVFLALTDAR